MSHRGRGPGRGLSLHQLVGDWGRRLSSGPGSRGRGRRRGGPVGPDLDRLESRTMLSVASATVMGPPPAAAAVESSASGGLLNLVLQPTARGSLGALAGVIASAGATLQATGIPGLYE